MGNEPEKPWSDEELKRRGVGYGKKALWVVDHPYRPSEYDISSMSRYVSAVWKAAERVTESFGRDERLKALFGYGPLQTRCILKDPGYRPIIPLGRLDAFVVDGTPRFMEFNTDGTAGWHYSSALTALWREHARLQAEASSLDDRLLATIIACFRRWDKKGVERPRIAVVDWDTVGTLPELNALAAGIGDAGFPVSIEDPRGLRLSSGRLVGSQGPIDIVYRRLVSEEAFARSEEIRPFLDAWLSDAACFVGGFCTDPAWSKTLFVVLSDPSYADLFPAELKADLDECIPWTRALVGGPVMYGGRLVDMENLLLERREEFLIKPARSYEGRGLLAGAHSSRDAWESGVKEALRAKNSIAQAFLRPDPESVPGLGRVFIQPGAYVLEGKLAGYLPRMSPTELITPGVAEYYCPVGVEVPW